MQTPACPSLSTAFRGTVLTDRLVGFCLPLLGSNYSPSGRDEEGQRGSFVPTQTCKSFSCHWTVSFHSMQGSLKQTTPWKLPAMDYSLSYFDHLKRAWLIRSVSEHKMEGPQVSWAVKIRSNQQSIEISKPGPVSRAMVLNLPSGVTL